MRKIYPPFAILVLYGLLSIAVTTLAQISVEPLSGCKSPQINPSSTIQVTIGYVQLFPEQPDLTNFPWYSYDYINIIAYPKGGEWNDIFRPKDPKKVLKPIEDFKAKKPSDAKAKFLLSIRNYNPTQWPEGEEYGKFVGDTLKTIDEYKLDGVDIEYPGMRGLICHDDTFGPNGPNIIWDKDNDGDFVGFIGTLRGEMNKVDANKIIMLTVGSDVIIGPNDLDSNIKFLNIETHHFSLYQNIRFPLPDPNVKSHPNAAPLNIFTKAHDEWTNIGGIGNEKIIMGVDFGNTFQVVANPSIKTTQTVDFVSTQELQGFDVKKIDDSIKIINNICPNEVDNQVYNRLSLYSWPWKHLSESVLDLNNCNAKDGWTINLPEKDPVISSTPWLFKADDTNPEQHYYYVSYEDINSISTKSNYSIGKSIGGMSVSDVSYDNIITKGSLLNIMQVIRGKKPENPSNGGTAPAGTSTGGTGKDPSPTTNPTVVAGGSNNSNLVNKGAIAGGVIGGLFGLIVLGACAFIGYRYRKKPKSESFRSLLMSIPSSIKNHTTTSRNTEMTSDPSPNMFAPPTTVIPVASGYVTAMFDFTGKEENDLSFKKGDKIEVLERGDGPNDWWVGRVNGAVGEFPGNYVKET